MGARKLKWVDDDKEKRWFLESSNGIFGLNRIFVNVINEYGRVLLMK
jgi:hypothetical protein